MQMPLTTSTVLHRRYSIQKLLGQGGFGRTYLAADLGRFNELCVLKEYIPSTGSEYALQKSKELFHREAQTLYQLHHPQVPELHETFEENGRLFLVQDYIEGPTYRRLLDQRLKSRQVFAEGEAFLFLQQMLPVLEYIHSKGIIHRDISPDNIILRQQDSMPVLIDFGIVKEVARVDLLEEEVENATTVGKLGYAPSEQLQTGKIYPSSDLYALAVTTVVLMTGRKSQELKDEESMTWRWQQWLPTLTPQFAQVLNRMLSSKPRSRYQSAAEASQALRTLVGLIPPITGPRTLTSDFAIPVQAKTNGPTKSSGTPSLQPPSLLSRTNQSIVFTQHRDSLKMPEWGLPAIGLGVAVIGVVSLTQIQPTVVAGTQGSPIHTATARPLPLQSFPTPTDPQFQTTNPTPSATSGLSDPSGTASTPTPDPNPKSTAEIVTEPIVFDAKSGRVQTRGRVDSSRVLRYVLNPQPKQKIQANLLEGETVASLHIRSANKSIESGITAWKFTAPAQPSSILIDVEAKASTDYLLELSVASD